MLVWVLFAVLTAFAAVMILYPYWRPIAGGTAAARDVDIYKQQLQEIEGELAGGLMGEEEARAARIEISRRLIAATEAADASAKQGAAGAAERTPGAAYVVVGALVAISLTIYALYGEPDLPAKPLATRADEPMTMQTYTDAIERQVRRYPKDGSGWESLGTLYMRSGRMGEAVKAYRKAVDIMGGDPDRLTNLAEAIVYAANGDVSAETRSLLERALAQDSTHGKANFLMGLAEERAGKMADAAERYKKLLQTDLTEDNKVVLRKRVAAIEAELKGGPKVADTENGAADSQPTPGKGGSASQATPGMMDAGSIAAAVNKLAARLKKDGSDLQGWLMLVRAYVVLGQTDDAKQAVLDAKGNFKGNDEAIGQIDELARSLGLTS